MNHRKALAATLSALAVATYACASLAPTPSATTTQAPSVASPPAPPPSTENPPTPPPALDQPTAASVPSRELSSVGPWIVFTNEQGIWGVNQDGSGLTLLTSEVPTFSGISAAPFGGSFAYLTGDGDPYRHVTVQIFSLPLRVVAKSIPLTTAATEPGPDAAPGDPILEAVRAAVDEPSLAWSPDGKNLAFVGVIEGETSDVYTYSVETGMVKRLSSGPSQAFAPSWSRDGKYVAHLGAAGFGSGAGHTVTGAWAARADGSGVITLENTNLGSAPRILGWNAVELSKLYLTAWDPGCGSHDVQEVDVESGRVRHIWESYFSQVALSPTGLALLLSIDQGSASCSGEQPGLIRVFPSGDVRREALGTPTQVKWLEETRQGRTSLPVVATDQGLFVLDQLDTPFEVAAPPGLTGLPIQVSGSDLLFWGGDGLWMGNLENLRTPPTRLFDGMVEAIFPSVEANDVVFFSGGGLWSASSSANYQPVRVSAAEGSHSAVWVER